MVAQQFLYDAVSVVLGGLTFALFAVGVSVGSR